MEIDAGASGSERDALLRSRLGHLCHFIRWTGIAWIVWVFAEVLMAWGDRDKVTAIYGRLFKADLSALPLGDHMLGLAIVLTDVAAAAAVSFFVWRLFGHYLRGNIFSSSAVDAMRNLGCAGVAAVLADLVTRPMLAWALTRHLGDGQPMHVWTDPQDLLHLLMALFIVALAHVFKTGVEIADENKHFV